MSAKVVLWDLMDTLVRDPFFTHVPQFFGLSFEQLLEQKHPTAWRDFELGRIDEQALYRQFFRDGREIDGPGLKRCMEDGYAWLPGMPELLGELQRAGHAMHLLSNYPPWYQVIDRRLGVTRYVAPSFVSCETGIRKPADTAFLSACRTLGVPPERCLFVDDRAVNCDAARRLGLACYRFDQDVPALREWLGEHGLS